MKRKRHFFVTLTLLSFIFISVSDVEPATRIPTASYSKKIALTFDDGPHPYFTNRLRAVLNRHKVTGTFFIVGKVASRYPSVIRTLAQEGHEIANHSWSHPSISKIDPSQFKKELDRTRQLIFQTTGVDTNLFRVPGSTERYLRMRFRVPKDYSLVLWDVHSYDHDGRTADEIVGKVLSEAKDGDIVLLHNGLFSTLDALDRIITELKHEGFQFVTVSDIFELKMKTKITSKRPTIISG